MKKIYIAPDIIVKMVHINPCMQTISTLGFSKSSASSSYNGGDDGNNDAKSFDGCDEDIEW